MLFCPAFANEALRLNGPGRAKRFPENLLFQPQALFQFVKHTLARPEWVQRTEALRFWTVLGWPGPLMVLSGHWNEALRLNGPGRAKRFPVGTQ